MEFIMPGFKISLLVSSALIVLFASTFATEALAGIKTKYWAIWDQSNESNTRIIDHGQFDLLLQRYVVVNHPSGINRFRYGDVSGADSKALNRYISHLAKIDPRDYPRREQKVYWINLYNALTVQTILHQYQNSSSLGALKNPVNKRKKLVKVARVKLSLKDIEHRILRPIWQDRKLLFALSCGALGCPNIQPEAYTSANSKQLLNRSVREFINHPRGLVVGRHSLQASKLFDWYAADFGSQKKMIKFFAHYAEDNKALYLLGFKGSIAYGYDSRINAPEVQWPS
jgi:hypothetical protein